MRASRSSRRSTSSRLVVGLRRPARERVDVRRGAAARCCTAPTSASTGIPAGVVVPELELLAQIRARSSWCAARGDEPGGGRARRSTTSGGSRKGIPPTSSPSAAIRPGTSTRSRSRCSSSAVVRSRSAADAYTRRRGDDRDRLGAVDDDGGALREARARLRRLALRDRAHRRRRAADRLRARVRVVARLPGGSVLPGGRRALVDRVRQPRDGALPDRALAGGVDLRLPHARPQPLGALARPPSPSSARSRRRRSGC